MVNEKQFISAQGPIQRTIGDFWRLIDEQSCQVIVMLTGIEEQGRIKCAQYWSDDQPTDVTAHLRVTLASRRDYSDYVIRRFTLQNLDTGIVREVLHFHFIAWRDFLAPEQPSWLLRFIKRVNEHHCPDRGPILVSALFVNLCRFIYNTFLCFFITKGALLSWGRSDWHLHRHRQSHSTD